MGLPDYGPVTLSPAQHKMKQKWCTSVEYFTINMKIISNNSMSVVVALVVKLASTLEKTGMGI